jgi:hypothetical protein
VAISAKFQADFESFHTEAQKAEGELENLAKGAGTVEQSLNKMVTAAPGMATLAANTETLAGAHTKAAATSQLLHGSLQKFDGVLASLGLNINTEIRAITELADAAGKTAGQVGAIGVAGLAIGAAVGGWKIGRIIAEWTGADEAISRATASLLGYGNVAAEIAGAKQDTINKAIRDGADANISYAEAVKFNTDTTKKHADAMKAFSDGFRAIDSAGQDWNKTLNTIDGSVVEAIKFYIGAGVAQKDLAAAYGLTADQIKAVAKAREADIDSMKLQQQMDKETFELAQQHQKMWRDEIEKTKDERNKAVIEGNEQSMKAEQDLIDFYAKGTLSSTDYQIFKIQEVVREQEAAFKGSIDQRVIFNQRVEELATQQAERLKAKEREVVAAAVQAEIDAINALNAIIPDIGHGPTAPNGQGPAPIVVKPIDVGSVFHNQNTNFTIPARASGGPVNAGQAYMVGERGPERFVPNANGTILPSGSGGPQVIQLVVDGRVLASIVNDYNTKNMRRGRQLPAA